MKKIDAARDAMRSRTAEEITFKAGLLALHKAIASGGAERKNPPEEFGSAPYFGGPQQCPLERARRPVEGIDSSEVRNKLNRPDPRGF